MSRVPGLVSIITIFYNAERFIEEAAASVISQTYSHWELLLVDDGSTDSSTQIAKDLASEHQNRIFYLRHPDGKNHGMSATRNLGIEHARGEFIAFLDADDIYFPEKLEVQVRILQENSDIPIVYGPLHFWYDWPGNTYKPCTDFICQLGEEHDVVVDPPIAVIRQINISDGLPGTCSVLIRSEAVREVGGFEEGFSGMYDDEAFFAKLFLKFRAFRMQNFYDHYRQHAESFCANSQRSGEYVMGPGMLSPSRLVFLKWLMAYTDKIGHPEICMEVERHISSKTCTIHPDDKTLKQ